MNAHRLQHAILLCTVLTTSVIAQNNPVYVDESPTAVELLKQADMLAGSNPGEAANIFQSLLDESDGQVVPLPDSGTRFTGIRPLVLQRLRTNPSLLEVWLDRADPMADELHARGELDEVERRWPLTRSGLHATITLAGRDLELAAFSRGMARLRRAIEHPAADESTNALAWHGLALGAVATANDAVLAEAVDALQSLGAAGTPMLADIDNWSFSGPMPDIDTPHEIGAAGDMDPLVGLSIWSTMLEQSLLQQRYGSPLRLSQSGRQTGGADVDPGWFTTAMPARYEDLIFLNLGQHIVAFDALTGLMRWEHAHRAQDIMLDPTQRPLGANDIEAQGRTLVTATGIDYGDERAGDGALLCLDGPTGHLRWSVVLDNHPDIERSEGMIPCSAPIVHEGIVYVLARVITPQRLHSESLVAIDLRDGRVLWSRWIASSARSRNHTARPVVRPQPIGDLILVRSSAGAIAGVDAVTGGLRWLHRLETPQDGTKDLRSRPFTGPRSILTPTGVLVIAPDDTVLLRIDPESGDILDRELLSRSDGLNSPLYLLGDEDHVYAIGDDLRCFDSKSLDAPVWTRPWSDIDRNEVPTGRIQLLQDSLLVPLAEQIIQIDTDTGTTLRSIEVDTTGNVLLADDRLIVASASNLETYTAFDQAEEALLSRISADPEDVELRMDLVRLAARGRNDELLINAGTDVLALIDVVSVPDAVRSRLLQHFIGMLQQDTTTPKTCERITGLMERTARNPQQRLEIQLALGDYWSSRQPERAAQHWVAVLDEPALSGALHAEDNIHARGAAWARQRLAALGDTVRIPSLWIETDDTQSTESQLVAARANLRWTTEAAQLSKTLPSILDRLQASGRHEAADALLQGWRVRHGDVPLMTSDGPWTPAVHSSEIGTTTATPQRIVARHIAPSPSSIADMSHDLVLMLADNTIKGVDAATFQTRWTQPTSAIFGNLLRADDDRLTLLLADRNGAIMLQEIDPETGATLGTLPNVADAFDTPPPAVLRLHPILPDGRMINMEDILAVANDSMVAFVRRDGATIVINGPIGGASMRQLALPVRVVHDLDAWPDGFVAIGPSPDAPQSVAVSNANPVLVHVDAESGDAQKIEWPGELGRVLWIERSPLDDLLLGGERGIAMIPRPDEDAIWMNTDPELQYSRKGWATGEALLLLDGEDQLITMNLADGSIAGPIGVPRHRTLGALKKIEPTPSGFRILREGALALHDPNGTFLGTDSLPGTMQHEHLVPIGTEYLLLTYLQSVARNQGAGRSVGRQHLYRVHRLDETGRLIDLFDLYPLPSRIRATRSLGSGLLLETDSTIELIPLPDDSVQ